MSSKHDILTALIFFILGFLNCLFIWPKKTILQKTSGFNPASIKKDTIYLHDTVYIKKVNASYYNPSKSQCDDSPFYTADGTFLSKKTKNLISLSRDLLKKYPFGSKIEVLHPKKLRGIYTVHDCMHKRFRNKIDFFTYGTINIRNVIIKYN